MTEIKYTLNEPLKRRMMVLNALRFDGGIHTFITEALEAYLPPIPDDRIVLDAIRRSPGYMLVTGIISTGEELVVRKDDVWEVIKDIAHSDWVDEAGSYDAVLDTWALFHELGSVGIAELVYQEATARNLKRLEELAEFADQSPNE